MLKTIEAATVTIQNGRQKESWKRLSPYISEYEHDIEWNPPKNYSLKILRNGNKL